MITYHENPWETITKSDLVSIGTHKLFLSTSGPPRINQSPVVIYLTGGGVPIAAHVRLQALLSVFVRVYFYDRSGYDLSEQSPTTCPTATEAAADLTSLLRAAQITPPYILVSHSYSGIIAREFLALHPSDDVVAGMVLVDTATELMYEVFYDRIPNSAFAAVASGVDFAKLTHLQEESGLSDKEWETALAAVERSEAAARAEASHESGRPLAAKWQLQTQAFGDRPLSVMRCNTASDYRIIYDAGVEVGNGTEDERAGARRFIETWELFDDDLMAAQLRLSSQARYVRIEDCGHDISLRKPELVVEQVRWVLGCLRS